MPVEGNVRSDKILVHCLWDTAEPDAAATLLALDLETLEIVKRFE